MFNLRRLVVPGLLALLVSAAPALAGPPLLCHPFDIGSARSLPWDGTSSWWNGKPDYNLQNLVADTEAILTPSTPVIVRMETLRRAALYASLDSKVAASLLSAITAKANASSVTALFDAGYLTETYKQIVVLRGEREFADRARTIAAVLGKADGAAMIGKAMTLRPDDPSLQFAAALIAASTDRNAYRAYAEQARKGATKDALLAKNLDKIS